MAEYFDSLNARMFVDFNQMDREVEVNESAGLLDTNGRHENHIESDPLEGMVEEYDEVEEVESRNSDVKLRRSISLGNLICCSKEVAVVSQSKEEKPRFMSKISVTEASSSLSLHHTINQDHLNQLALPKRYSSTQNVNKFVSLAESVNSFYNGQCSRFHSSPNVGALQRIKHLKTTIPCSPHLLTKDRARKVTVLSQTEKEELEFQNVQKFKFKAQQVNKKIFQGPLKPTVSMIKKGPTIPQPFALTEVQHKKIMPSPEKFEFHAQPVPHSLKEPPKFKTPEKKCTKPITPTFMKTWKKSIANSDSDEHGTPKYDSSKPIQRTKVEPFSFEDRDKMLQKIKEQKIQKVFEEEKKARDFHANPVPKFIYKQMDQLRCTSISSSSNQSEAEETEIPQFKAKPATVLYKEPFVPKKLDVGCTEPLPINLNTEVRAQEREEFDRRKQKKEEKLIKLRQLREEEIAREEKEKELQMRKEMEFKAQPIKKYKEIKIVLPHKITTAVSPKFRSGKIRNKENIDNNTPA